MTSSGNPVSTANDAGLLHRRELTWLIVAWLALAAMVAVLAKQNLSIPGLYYDEAVFGGLAKDFLNGKIHPHMPGNEIANFFGRPFPVFVQAYLGALKSWMLMPAIALFGSSVPVLRSATLCWGLIALLFFMLGTRLWLGLRTALLAGLLLALDPSYFFLSVMDWGAAVSGLLCRCVCFYLILLWWRRRRASYLFVTALFAGLGVFNKVDFAALLVAVGIAGVCCYGHRLWAVFRARPFLAALACAGFLLGAGPMLLKVPGILMYAASGQNSAGPGEFSEKLHTLFAMYDGSYFYRLMNVGGVFEKMYQEPAAVHSTLGLVLLIACVALAAMTIRSDGNRGNMRAAGFLFLAAVLTTIGVFLVPGSVRIHHAILVFPFPQLIIAAAAIFLWERGSTSRTIHRATRTLILIGILVLLGSQLRMILKTQQLIRETGGRGRWSESLDAFCRENRNRTDLTIISLDWGFNEQLVFLTDGPRLAEPAWALGRTIPPNTPLVRNPSYIYLLHPIEYSVAPESVTYLNAVQNDEGGVEIRPYFDRQNRIAFYAVRFPIR
jgi:hypothetical protein